MLVVRQPVTTGARSRFRPTGRFHGIDVLVAEYEITDAANFQKWGVASNSVGKAHGAEVLSRRNKVAAAAGDPPKNVTIVRFPSMEKAQEYLQSAEYKALIPNRDASAKFRSFVVQGGDLATQ
jgi:uncharacterized protein (DUF1330 family)